MNAGGTVLSYSDLLLSIAVAQWSKLDARQEIHGLVDEINRIGHLDHVFPKSLLQRRRLEKLDCSTAVIEECLSARDKLANLQLLEGLLNVSKGDSLPAEWLSATYPDPTQRQAVLDRHDLGKLPATAAEFMEFYEARRERMRQRLATLLSRGTEAQEAAVAAA